MLIRSTEDGLIGKTASGALYLPAGEDLDRIRIRLNRELTPAAFQRLRIQKLSPEATFPKIEDHGLLYLPKPISFPAADSMYYRNNCPRRQRPKLAAIDDTAT
jgi:hypothetical protein